MLEQRGNLEHAVVGDSLIQSAGGCHNGAGECVLHGKMGVGNCCRLGGHP